MTRTSAIADLDRDTPLYDPFLEGQCDTDAMNSLLRGELSAIESYDQALEKFPDEPAIAELRLIRREHFNASCELRDRIRAYGGDPAETSGAWGVFASAVAGTAKAFGWKAELAALKQGEEHGINSYESALDNEDIAHECRDMIRGELLPMCRQHAAALTQIIAAAG